MWFVLAVLAVAAYVGFGWKRYYLPKSGTWDVGLLTRHLAESFALALAAAFFLTFISDTVVIVPAGSRGVIFDVFRGVKSEPLGEGMNFVIPMVQKVTMIDVRIQRDGFEAEAASKDLQTVRTTISLNLHPSVTGVAQLFQEVGTTYKETIVGPAVQEVLKACTARYTAEELIMKREKVKEDIHAGLVKILQPLQLELVETYITDFQFSPEFSKAIEQKQVVQQESLKAQRDLERIRIEADQQIAKARAEAEALRMQRDAITSQLLDLKRIEMQRAAIKKWDGHMPEVAQGDSMPFLDLSTFGARKGAGAP